MVRARSRTTTVTSTSAPGEMTERMGSASILMLMVHGMRDTGEKISNMGRGRRAGPMGPCMTGRMSTERKRDTAFTSGKTALSTLVNGMIIK